ncbi:MAG: hypothetical protein LAO78_28760 [Acidobacteriia bacterium]|nr:hypothetical protein [Terriglobia bacterium]
MEPSLATNTVLDATTTPTGCDPTENVFMFVPVLTWIACTVPAPTELVTNALPL